ncbi:hypothetical protein CKA32_000869 [Geitlerinema sp. FC II]|nr:hypothetical protein CKA32_000869 [Geitlerinema sp. FC II]
MVCPNQSLWSQWRSSSRIQPLEARSERSIAPQTNRRSEGDRCRLFCLISTDSGT